MKYIAKQLMMTALLLMTATTLWAAGSITVVKKLNGTANTPASGDDPEVLATYTLGDPNDPFAIDITFIYDAANHDWVPIETRI